MRFATRTLLAGVVLVVAISLRLGARASVTVYASVTDESGRVVNGLSTSDFVLEIDGKPRDATVSPDSASGAFVLLLDRSGSMTPMLDEIADLSNAIVAGLPPGTRARLAQAVPQVQIRPPEPLPNQRDVAEAIRHLPILSKTAVWDATASSIKALDGITGYKSIVIISDGDDAQSRLRAPQVTELAQAAGVVAHGVFLVPPPAAMVGRLPDGASFRKFVEDTGGIYWPARSVNDPAALGAQVATTLSTRYAVTFDQPADGKVHDVRLRTTKGQVKVAVAKKLKT